MPAWHPGPFCIYHISASVLWRAFCCGGCPCFILPHPCLSQHAPLTCHAVTIDLINILLRSKHAPSAHEHSPHHQHGHRPHQAHELHGIDLHPHQGHGKVPGDGAYPCAGQQAQECKQIAPNGVERNMGGGVLLGQVQIEDIGIGQIQAHVENVLHNAERNIQKGSLRRHGKEEHLRGHPAKQRHAEGFHPGIAAQQLAPCIGKQQEEHRVHH